MEKCDVTYACGHTEEQQAKAEELDLPDLTGTPRQVAWAESLRIGVFEKLDFEKLVRGKNPDAEFLSWLKGQTESRFWIDNKGASIALLEKKWNNKKEETKLEGTPKQVAWAEKIREELIAVVEENMGQEWFGLNALDLETSAATIISYHTDYRGRFDDLLKVLAERAKEL